MDVLEPFDRGGHVGGGDVAGDDHLGGVGGRDAREAPLECQGAGLGEGVVGQRADARSPGVEAEDREGCREQHEHASGQERSRTAYDGTDGLGPEGALGGVVAADDRQPQRVDPVAQQGQQGGQQGDGRGHGDDADDDRAERQAAQDGVRDQEQAEQGHHEGAPGEQDGLAAGAAGGDDRVDLVAAGLPLLPVAGEYEEAVVDAQRESHRGDHVDDEEGQRGELPQDRGDGDGHDDGQDGDAHRDERGHQGAEDQDQHDHRGGQPELQLPVREVGLRELGEVVVEGVHPGDVDLEVFRGVGGDDLVDHLDDPVLGVVAEHQRHDRGVPVLRDAGLVGGVGVADGLGGAGGLDRGPDLRDERLELRVVAGEVGRVDDHGVVDPVGLGEVVGDHLLGSDRVGIGGDAAVGGERRPEKGRDGHDRGRQDQSPSGQDSPGVDGGDSCQGLGDRRTARMRGPLVMVLRTCRGHVVLPLAGHVCTVFVGADEALTSA